MKAITQIVSSAVPQIKHFQRKVQNLVTVLVMIWWSFVKLWIVFRVYNQAPSIDFYKSNKENHTIYGYISMHNGYWCRYNGLKHTWGTIVQYSYSTCICEHFAYFWWLIWHPCCTHGLSTKLLAALQVSTRRVFCICSLSFILVKTDISSVSCNWMRFAESGRKRTIEHLGYFFFVLMHVNVIEPYSMETSLLAHYAWTDHPSLIHLNPALIPFCLLHPH